MGTFRNPVGPLSASIYWRRRLVVLGVPLFVIFLIAYACTGTSGTPQNTAGTIGTHASASPTGNGVITPAPDQTQSGPGEGSYPGNGPGGGANGNGSGGAASPGTTSAGSAGGAGAAAGGVSGGGCVLALSIALDRTSVSGPVTYPAGTFPTFKINATDNGGANCRLDVSGRALVITVAPQGSTTPKWSSADCSGGSDLRVLGPSDTQTYPVEWKRWESQGSTCPVSKLPTVPPGGYTVSATVNGVTATPVTFDLG